MNESRHLEEAPVPDRTLAPISEWERDECPPTPPSAVQWAHPRLRSQVRITDIYSERRRFEAVLNEEEKDGGHESDEPASAPDSTWILDQLQTIIRELQGNVESGSTGKTEDACRGRTPERVKPVRTPRSELPLQSARPAELLRPEFCKGRLYFSCPCCRFPAALPVSLAGKKARCPRCYSAIRAPHPRKGLKTRVFENDVEALLHPERFSRYDKAHKLIPWLGLPLPRFQQAFHAAGVTVLMAILAVFAPALTSADSAAAARFIAPPGEPWGERPYYKERARLLVEQFLAADSVREKAAFVRDGRRVAPLMEDWYNRRPGGRSLTPVAIDVSGTGFYAHGLEYPVTDVHVQLADGADVTFAVEHLPEGDRIEWESSVGYNADISSLLHTGAEAGRQTMRVMASLDDYYNFNFQDSASHVCVRLHDPATLEVIGYGYAPQSGAGGDIAAQFSGTGARLLCPLTIEVEPMPDVAKTRQMEIIRMLEPGWRTDESSSRIASATRI
jgi:hypothetical protein